MAVNNSLTKKKEAPSNGAVTEYISNGEMVRISPSMIRRYLVSGGGNPTDEEVTMFLSLCKFQKLNPFLREAYLIKFGNSPATMVVGKDVFMKRAKKQAEFEGYKAGVIIFDVESGNIINREGTFYLKETERLVGGWAEVYIKGYQSPIYASVCLDEYIGKKKDGTVNAQWSDKPATMIRKVALSQALKEAFPDANSGMEVQEEISEASEIELESSPVVVAEVVEEPQKPVQPVETVADALFE